MIPDSQAFKKGIYGHLARVGKALSSPGRLHIIDLLCEGPKTVENLAEETGMKFANTSRHLQTLLEARLVEFEKKGIYSYYQISDPLVMSMFHAMQELGENLIKDIKELVDEIYGKDSKIEHVDCKDLVRRLQGGKVTLIDVRPKKEYDDDHIPGASSIPLEELEEHLSSLSPDQEIIAYCRGRYCLLSVEAVSILKKKGYHAVRLDDRCMDLDESCLNID